MVRSIVLSLLVLSGLFGGAQASAQVYQYQAPSGVYIPGQGTWGTSGVVPAHAAYGYGAPQGVLPVQGYAPVVAPRRLANAPVVVAGPAARQIVRSTPRHYTQIVRSNGAGTSRVDVHFGPNRTRVRVR